MRNFKFLTGDINFSDYGGKWYRRVRDRVYHVIELMNMNEVCGRDNVGQPTYNVDLCEIDLTDNEQIDSALRSCGYKIRGNEIVSDYQGVVVASGDSFDLCIVEALHSFGAKAPLDAWDGNNWRALMTEARKYSREISADAAEHERAMNRPVNKIGSTAREYARGDIDSAIARGVVRNDPNALLMAKIQGVSSEALSNAINDAAEKGEI